MYPHRVVGNSTSILPHAPLSSIMTQTMVPSQSYSYASNGTADISLSAYPNSSDDNYPREDALFANSSTVPRRPSYPCTNAEINPYPKPYTHPNFQFPQPPGYFSGQASPFASHAGNSLSLPLYPQSNTCTYPPAHNSSINQDQFYYVPPTPVDFGASISNIITALPDVPLYNHAPYPPATPTAGSSYAYTGGLNVKTPTIKEYGDRPCSHVTPTPSTSYTYSRSSNVKTPTKEDYKPLPPPSSSDEEAKPSESSVKTESVYANSMRLINIRLRPRPEKFVSLSCQCVGIREGGDVPMLARVAVVDYRGHILVDCLVGPTEPVTSYRTATTGLVAEHFQAEDMMAPFSRVKAAIADLIKDKIVVGHSLWNDLCALDLKHPAIDTRDVACYIPFRMALCAQNYIPNIKVMIWELMHRHIRREYINPVEDARAVIDLFRSREVVWEDSISSSEWPCGLPPYEFLDHFT